MCWRARAARSSCSGLLRQRPSGSWACLSRTVPNCVASCRLRRGSTQRVWGCSRNPKVLLCRHQTRRKLSACSGATRAVSSWAVRPFFMAIAWLNTSKAPAWRSSSARKARSSAVASSIWACCTSTVSSCSSAGVDSARVSRSRLGRSRLREPSPTPTCLGTWVGGWPKRVAQQAAKARPVGVVSSPGGKPTAEARGIARKRASSNTAGAGRGRVPWAVATRP